MAGRSDFRAVAHFHAWYRSTRGSGETVPIRLLRKGKRLDVELVTL